MEKEVKPLSKRFFKQLAVLSAGAVLTLLGTSLLVNTQASQVNNDDIKDHLSLLRFGVSINSPVAIQKLAKYYSGIEGECENKEKHFIKYFLLSCEGKYDQESILESEKLLKGFHLTSGCPQSNPMMVDSISCHKKIQNFGEHYNVDYGSIESKNINTPDFSDGFPLETKESWKEDNE